MSDELVTTQIEEAPPVVTEIVATIVVQPEGQIDQPPDPATLQAEIERLQKVREKAETDAQYWRKQKVEARGDYFKGREQPPPPVKPTEDLGIGKEPKQEEFDDYQKYLDAKIGYEVNKAKVTWDRELITKQADKERQTKIDVMNEKIQTLGYQEFTDFEDIALSQTVPITPLVRDILAECEHPHRVAYYLGKNKAEAIQIARMNPIQASRAIAKIEADIARVGLPISDQPLKIPSAPPPIKPLGASHTIEKDLNKMSQKEFEEEMVRRTGRRF